jgi:hypothetical protein
MTKQRNDMHALKNYLHALTTEKQSKITSVVVDNARLHGDVSQEFHADFDSQLSPTPSAGSMKPRGILDARWDDSLEFTENPAMFSPVTIAGKNRVMISPMSPTRRDSFEMSPNLSRRQSDKNTYFQPHEGHDCTFPAFPIERG